MKFQKVIILPFIAILLSLILSACKEQYINPNSFEYTQSQLEKLLYTQKLNPEQRYTIIKQMAQNLLDREDYQGAILLLTDWVENNPDDVYNSYWLLMTAYAYLSIGAEPIAESYFDRILQNPDLIVRGKSVHFMCLQKLTQISKTPANRIKYINELISRFSEESNITELYLRLALEYEKNNQWDQALRACDIFLNQPDATTIQIPGEPDAYKNARHLVDFNNSPKDWTFKSLQELEDAVKKAMKNYDWRALDRYKAKVNFFHMSWKQDENDANSMSVSSMHDWMMGGNRIRYNETLDETSNPNEAYLKTWGWSTYVSVWYLYFRKIDFPLDPDINGNWEWAGIYVGNKL